MGTFRLPAKVVHGVLSPTSMDGLVPVAPPSKSDKELFSIQYGNRRFVNSKTTILNLTSVKR